MIQWDEAEHFEQPIFTVEIWDSDVFSANDFIGKHVSTYQKQEKRRDFGSKI